MPHFLGMSLFLTELTDRAGVHISGPDAADFLQNLVTQNIATCQPGTLTSAALLTPQGKLLFDFLIFGRDDGYLLDCQAAQSTALQKRLALYKLRAAIDITPIDAHPFALWQNAATPAPLNGAVADPRHRLLGLRHWGPLPNPPSEAALTGLADWHRHRLALGVPEGADDMPPGKVFPLEFGLAQMQAIDFKKGCFVGQEVTSRTHRKGQLRKRLWPAQFDSAAPPVETDIKWEARTVGEVVARDGNRALVLLRDDAREKADAHALRADGQTFTLSDGLFEA